MPTISRIQPSTPRPPASLYWRHFSFAQYPLLHSAPPHVGAGTLTSFDVASVRPTVTMCSFLSATSSSALTKYVITYCLLISSRSCWNAAFHESAAALRTQRNVPSDRFDSSPSASIGRRTSFGEYAIV